MFRELWALWRGETVWRSGIIEGAPGRRFEVFVKHYDGERFLFLKRAEGGFGNMDIQYQRLSPELATDLGRALTDAAAVAVLR